MESTIDTKTLVSVEFSCSGHNSNMSVEGKTHGKSKDYCSRDVTDRKNPVEV